MPGPERRFNEAEVAAIIETATNWKDPRRQPVPSGAGLTLDQLQEIGREIGIAPNSSPTRPMRSRTAGRR